MKKWVVEWAVYLTVATAYSIWRYRDELKSVIDLIDDDLIEQAQYRKAVEATLRSIRRLPETDA